MLLLVDNYDSFTYNLFQCLSEIGEEVVVVRNNETSLEEIEKLGPQRIVISPGPSTPLNAGLSNAIIGHFGPRVPLLGVCLGHQCIAHSYGATVVRAREVMHGKSSLIYHRGLGLFRGLPNPFSAIRYHSLETRDLPECLEATAWTADGVVMGLRHRDYPIWGVQFHPESFMTEKGKELLNNFLLVGGKDD